jgi:lysyl-tRNA synthetase class 2
MDNQNQLLKQRRDKAQTLADAGVNLFSNDFKNPQPVKDILPLADALEPETHAPDDAVYRIAGRIMSLRKFGKAAFFHVQDESGKMQVYARRDLLGEEFQRFKNGMWAILSGLRAGSLRPRPVNPRLRRLVCT